MGWGDVRDEDVCRGAVGKEEPKFVGGEGICGEREACTVTRWTGAESSDGIPERGCCAGVRGCCVARGSFLFGLVLVLRSTALEVEVPRFGERSISIRRLSSFRCHMRSLPTVLILLWAHMQLLVPLTRS